MKYTVWRDLWKATVSIGRIDKSMARVSIIVRQNFYGFTESKSQQTTMFSRDKCYFSNRDPFHFICIRDLFSCKLQKIKKILVSFGKLGKKYREIPFLSAPLRAARTRCIYLMRDASSEKKEVDFFSSFCFHSLITANITRTSLLKKSK